MPFKSQSPTFPFTERQSLSRVRSTGPARPRASQVALNSLLLASSGLLGVLRLAAAILAACEMIFVKGRVALLPKCSKMPSLS